MLFFLGNDPNDILIFNCNMIQSYLFKKLIFLPQVIFDLISELTVQVNIHITQRLADPIKN